MELGWNINKPGPRASNLWRYTDDTKEFIEIKLSDQHSTFINASRKKLVFQYAWYVAQEHHNFYARSNKRHTTGYKTLRLHALLRPDLTIVDHIDQSGLNNRDDNLRCGLNGVNNRNCRLNSRNTSGRNGVIEENSTRRRRFRVKWRPSTGEKQTSKSFSFKKNDEDSRAKAFADASAFRLLLDKQLNCTNGHEVLTILAPSSTTVDTME